MQRNLLTVLNTDWSLSEDKLLLRLLWVLDTAWKVSKYGVFSGPYFPVFGLNAGKYRPGKTPYVNTFHAVLVSKLVWEILLNNSCLLTLPGLGFCIWENFCPFCMKFCTYTVLTIWNKSWLKNWQMSQLSSFDDVIMKVICWRFFRNWCISSC